MHTKTLWIKEEYLQQILAGHKTIEVRVAYNNIAKLTVGDTLILNDKHPFTIIRIGRYANFEALLHYESATAIAPNIDPDDLLTRIREIYPPEKEALGVVALEIKPANDANTTEPTP